MNTDRFTKTVVPDADGSKFSNSSKHHCFVGRSTSSHVFMDGGLRACHEFCPCCECLLGRCNSCTLKSEMGVMHPVSVPWVSGPPLRQLEELAAWGELLKMGMIVAFTAHAKDNWMEGSYWLALICGPAHPVPEELARASLLVGPHAPAAHICLISRCRSMQVISSRLAGSWSKRGGLSSSPRARDATSCRRRSGELRATQTLEFGSWLALTQLTADCLLSSQLSEPWLSMR
eukprot:652283-Prymnesium_polylepis.1